MSKYLIAVVTVLTILVLAGGIYWFVFLHTGTASNACVSSLRQIAAAKKQWGDDYGKTSTNIPTWNDLKPYLYDNWKPHCQSDGYYTIGRLDEPPKCSIGGRGHKLSRGDWTPAGYNIHPAENEGREIGVVSGPTKAK